MNNVKKENHNINKIFSIICLLLIPLAAGVGIIFDIIRDPFQILLMALGFLILARIHWLKYKEESKL